MGHKVHPVGFRLGYIRKSDANWFASKKNYASKLLEDRKIRKYLEARVIKAGISRIIIERADKKITITIQTARPGIVVGKSGVEVDKIRKELKKLIDQEININVFEIKKPELDAKLIGNQIVQQLQGRVPYKRVMKQAIALSMRMGAKGIKIQVSGRLDGAEIARSEQYKEGTVSLHTLRSNIDYALSEAHTIYGRIGVKIWIFKGVIYGDHASGMVNE